MRGQLPVGHARVVKIYEVDEPGSFARALLIEALRRRGVRVAASPLGYNDTGSLPPRTDVAKLPKVAEYTSPPFSEYIRVILKVSHNLHASTLPLLLAARHGERTLAAGLKRQGEILKSLGVEPGTISFGGGAGGARADLASPRATVNLLRAMASRPEFAAYDAALPILGRDGTLAKAVAKDSPARGHARAKTGTYLRRERAGWHNRPDQQGTRRLSRDRLGPFADLRGFRQQRAARRPQARSSRLRSDRGGRAASGQTLRSVLRGYGGQLDHPAASIRAPRCRRQTGGGGCQSRVSYSLTGGS